MQSLFYYKFVFMTELLIAETIFCFHLRRRKYFVLRLFGAIAICYLVAGFYPLASYTGWYASLMFIAFFLCGFLSIPLCFETSWKNALLFCRHESSRLIALFPDDKKKPGIPGFFDESRNILFTSFRIRACPRERTCSSCRSRHPAG